MNDIEIKRLKLIHVIKRLSISVHTIRVNCKIDLTALAVVHIDKGTECLTYLCVLCECRSKVQQKPWHW
jgi:hypothetical protein